MLGKNTIGTVEEIAVLCRQLIMLHKFPSAASPNVHDEEGHENMNAK